MAKPVAVSDAAIQELLEQIRAGEMTAVGVLADYLNEKRKPRRRSVRRAWERYVAFLSEYGDRAAARRVVRKMLRDEIAFIYGRKWNPLPDGEG